MANFVDSEPLRDNPVSDAVPSVVLLQTCGTTAVQVSDVAWSRLDDLLFALLPNVHFRVWKDNNNTKKFSPQTAELYRSAFILRQRMMSAIQNIGSFFHLFFSGVKYEKFNFSLSNRILHDD